MDKISKSTRERNYCNNNLIQLLRSKQTYAAITKTKFNKVNKPSSVTETKVKEAKQG